MNNDPIYYCCEVCGESFMDLNECLAHENAHKAEKEEFLKTNPLKFKVGDAVMHKGKAYRVAYADAVPKETGGFAKLFRIWKRDLIILEEVSEEDLELIAPVEKVNDLYWESKALFKERLGLSFEDTISILTAIADCDECNGGGCDADCDKNCLLETEANHED